MEMMPGGTYAGVWSTTEFRSIASLIDFRRRGIRSMRVFVRNAIRCFEWTMPGSIVGVSPEAASTVSANSSGVLIICSWIVVVSSVTANS
jgi:hypothetical protein